MDNTKFLERQSINAICQLCDDRMIPYLSDNDKTPSYDGNIVIMQGDSKKGMKKIPVQIKARTRFNGSIPIDVVDLDNFYRNEGVVYFVYDANEKKLYAKVLMNYDINKILSGKKNNKSISVKFTREINNSNQLYELLCEYHKKSFDEKEFADFTYYDPKNDSISAIKVFNFDIINGVGKEFYANIKTSKNQTYYTRFELESIEIFDEKEIKVISKNVVFNDVAIKKTMNSVKIKVNNFFELEINNNHQLKSEINWKKATIDLAIKACNFIFDISNTKKIMIYINKKIIDIDLKESLYDIGSIKETLNKIKCIESFLIRLNIDVEKIYLGDISNKTIGSICKIMGDNSQINNGNYILDIGDISYFVGMYYINDKLHIFNLIEDKLKLVKFYCKYKDDWKEIPSYLTIRGNILGNINEKDKLILFDNLKNLEIDEENFPSVQLFSLELISAFDSSGDNKFLLEALSLTERLNYPDLNKENFINRLQIKVRLGETITKQEKEDLYIGSKSSNSQYAFCCNVLLRNIYEAEIMSSYIPIEYKTYPIWKLYTDLTKEK